MDFLLDTHTFLWFINGDNQLSSTAKAHIENVDTIKYVGIASFWEIAIKMSLGKQVLEMSFSELKDHVYKNSFQFLPITFYHTENLTQLDHRHKDPFDRLIIAQALTDQLTIITRDSNFGKYKVNPVW